MLGDLQKVTVDFIDVLDWCTVVDGIRTEMRFKIEAIRNEIV